MRSVCGAPLKLASTSFSFTVRAKPISSGGLKPLAQERDDVILASGSGSRTRRIAGRPPQDPFRDWHGADTIIFFAEYIHPGDNAAAVFGGGGVLDELRRWKTEGLIRYVGASARPHAGQKLANDARVDVLMHRFNMAHRKAEAEVFPRRSRRKRR